MTETARIPAQQKQSLVVRQAITARESQQKPQGFRHTKSNPWLFVRRSQQKSHDRRRKGPQQKQSSIVPQAITAKDSRQKPQGFPRRKSNPWLFVKRSPQESHDRSRKDSGTPKAILGCS